MNSVQEAILDLQTVVVWRVARAKGLVVDKARVRELVEAGTVHTAFETLQETLRIRQKSGFWQRLFSRIRSSES